eukprot:TRINITY_DN1387_c0_g2_i2.p1 TRINITY_DN1387_c0_g2~~TRINITY_DN1387_c0_g2_i2.p1  ORF type:complete len:319 (+),score=65.54 TRINITY_DN1387_c0_g2_i2:189-1145(+)
MIPSITKKAKGLVDASDNNNNNNNNNVNTSTSTSSEPILIDLVDGLPNEELKRKAKPSKGKEKVIDDAQRDSLQRNYARQQQNDKRLRLLPGDPVICQLIQAANLFQKLDLKSILSLAHTSKQIFKQLSPLISDRFMCYFHANTNIQHFHPKKFLILTSNLDGLFNNPFLSNVREVKFDDNFDFAYTKLPSSVTHITFSNLFDRKLTQLPTELTHLKLGNNFNQMISRENLPFKLTHLNLGWCFNQYISSLPDSVQQITFFPRYRQTFHHLSKSIQLQVKVLENDKWITKPYQLMQSPFRVFANTRFNSQTNRIEYTN